MDYGIAPGSGAAPWGRTDYPPKGDHVIEIVDAVGGLSYSNKVKWDITIEAVDVGGTLTDKAPMQKVQKLLQSLGLTGDTKVQPADIIGKRCVARFGDAKGAQGNKLYRSVIDYFPAGTATTPTSEVDYSPPPRAEIVKSTAPPPVPGAAPVGVAAGSAPPPPPPPPPPPTS